MKMFSKADTHELIAVNMDEVTSTEIHRYVNDDGSLRRFDQVLRMSDGSAVRVVPPPEVFAEMEAKASA